MIENVTVVDTRVLNCGIYDSPLKPPIFQCEVGHMVCSRCSKRKMSPSGARNCHACRRERPGGYSRCFGAEHILESFQVPCPNAASGCSAMLPYTDQQPHLRQECRHAPCHCPAEGCTFAGSTWALKTHFDQEHRWPRKIIIKNDGLVKVTLNEGFNVIQHYRCPTMEEGNERPPVRLYLFLLNVVREPHARVVTAFYVHRAVTADESAPMASACRLKLVYESPCRNHRQESTFIVACTDLFGGLPSSDDCFEFVVSKSIHPLQLDTMEIWLSIGIDD